MTLERSFRLSSLFMTTSGFIGLVLTGKISPLAALLGGLVLVLHLIHASNLGFTRIMGLLSNLPKELWNVLVISTFFVCMADMVWISQDVLLAGINFLIVIMIYKLFHLKVRKDFLYLYAVSFLLLLSAAALTTEPWYGLVFLAFLLSSIWTLLLYHLRNEAEEYTLDTFGGGMTENFPITAKFFWATNGIAFAALFITTVIFFITPRTGVGFFQHDRGQAIRTSGFSQTVDLGVIGSIKLDPTVVMRVELPNQQERLHEPLYLQGAIFDHYDGRRWLNSFHLRQPVGRRHDGKFMMAPPRQILTGSSHTRQDIVMEALDSTVLFGIPTIQSIQGEFLILQKDQLGGVHLPYSLRRRFQYSVESRVATVTAQERQASYLTYPTFISNFFLQRPEASPRVEALARDVTRQAPTIFDKISAIKWHLISKYKYQLDVGNALPVNPVEEFLFERKTGYCEHYATAMVMMLRSIGIPSRLVTGFLPTDWNVFGNYYTVRQQDAHAWVEVYFPESGWVIVDPTPPGGAIAPSSTMALMSRYIDSLRLKWNRVVIQYSFRDQRTILREIREQSEPARTQAWGSVTTMMKWVRNWQAWIISHVHNLQWQQMVIWIGGIALCIYVLRVLIQRRRWALKPRQTSNPTHIMATKLYGHMLRILDAHGVQKAPQAGPLEFAGHVSSLRPNLAPIVQPLTYFYCRGRFGSIPPKAEELEEANNLLSKLRRELTQTTGTTQTG